MSLGYRQLIGRMVRSGRQNLGLNQAEVAKAIGIDPTYLSHIETGKVSLRPDHYEILVKTLKLDRETFGKFVLQHTNPWLFALIYAEAPADLRRDAVN